MKTGKVIRKSNASKIFCQEVASLHLNGKLIMYWFPVKIINLAASHKSPLLCKHIYFHMKIFLQ